MDKYERLQAIKNGSNKRELQSLIKSKSQQQSFQAIPEPKQRRRPNQGDQPVQRVEVQENFGPIAQGNSELSAIEAMFDGGSTPSYTSVGSSQQLDTNLNVDNLGPIFDPVAALAKKREMSKTNQFMKFAQKETVEEALKPLEKMTSNSNQNNFDFDNMKKMMEQIAKNTISEALDEHIKRSKRDLVYENITKASDGNQVIKAADGNYYKLVPVRVKKT